jgi:hypothetical protein
MNISSKILYSKSINARMLKIPVSNLSWWQFIKKRKLLKKYGFDLRRNISEDRYEGNLIFLQKVLEN